jgi:hypothetical protein
MLCKRCGHQKWKHRLSCINGSKDGASCSCLIFAKDNLDIIEQEVFLRGINVE